MRRLTYVQLPKMPIDGESTGDQIISIHVSQRMILIDQNHPLGNFNFCKHQPAFKKHLMSQLPMALKRVEASCFLSERGDAFSIVLEYSVNDCIVHVWPHRESKALREETSLKAKLQKQNLSSLFFRLSQLVDYQRKAQRIQKFRVMDRWMHLDFDITKSRSILIKTLSFMSCSHRRKLICDYNCHF